MLDEINLAPRKPAYHSIASVRAGGGVDALGAGQIMVGFIRRRRGRCRPLEVRVGLAGPCARLRLPAMGFGPTGAEPRSLGRRGEASGMGFDSRVAALFTSKNGIWKGEQLVARTGRTVPRRRPTRGFSLLYPPIAQAVHRALCRGVQSNYRDAGVRLLREGSDQRERRLTDADRTRVVMHCLDALFKAIRDARNHWQAILHYYRLKSGCRYHRVAKQAGRVQWSRNPTEFFH